MQKRQPLVKARRMWRINPRTRVKPSRKVYSRRRVKKQTKEEIKKRFIDEA